MDAGCFNSIFLLWSVILPSVLGHGSMAAIHKKLQRLDNDVIQLQMEVPDIEGRVNEELALTEEYLEDKLINTIIPQYINTKVQESLSDILSGRGLEDMVSGYAVKQMETLRENLHQMKRRYHVMARHVKDLAMDNEKWKENFIKGQRQGTSTPTSQLPTASVSSVIPTTPALIVERDMDLLIAPHNTVENFQRLHLNQNSMTNFPLRMKNVDSVTYIAKLRSLFLSVHDPKKRLLLFNTDTRKLTTVRNNVLSNGMTVDEVRQVVFLTTESPVYSVSKMEINGWKYRVIVGTSRYGGEPYGIAVDPGKRTIYASVSNKLLSVDYDGHNVQTLHTGSNMYSVALDLSVGVLYFNNNKKVYKRSLSGSTPTEMFDLNDNPFTIVYYNSSVYALTTTRVYHCWSSKIDLETGPYGLVSKPILELQQS